MPGLYLEEFEVGRTYEHKLARSVYLSDSIQFACMMMDSDPTFINEHWASRHARYKRIEIHPLYVFSIVQGAIVKEHTLGTTIGNLYMGEIEFPTPVFPGDTIYARTKVLGTRPSSTKLDRGVVECLHEGFNQNGDVVTRCNRKGMMLRRPASADVGQART